MRCRLAVPAVCQRSTCGSQPRSMGSARRHLSELLHVPLQHHQPVVHPVHLGRNRAGLIRLRCHDRNGVRLGGLGYGRGHDRVSGVQPRGQMRRPQRPFGPILPMRRSPFRRPVRPMRSTATFASPSSPARQTTMGLWRSISRVPGAGNATTACPGARSLAATWCPRLRTPQCPSLRPSSCSPPASLAHECLAEAPRLAQRRPLTGEGPSRWPFARVRQAWHAAWALGICSAFFSIHGPTGRLVGYNRQPCAPDDSC